MNEYINVVRKMSDIEVSSDYQDQKKKTILHHLWLFVLAFIKDTFLGPSKSLLTRLHDRVSAI